MEVLPAELIIDIYTYLPSLNDALSLSATSQRLRTTFADHLVAIYNAIGPSEILCESHARSFINAGKGKPLDLPITSYADIVKILRYAKIAESSAEQFSTEVIPYMGRESLPVQLPSLASLCQLNRLTVRKPVGSRRCLRSPFSC